MNQILLYCPYTQICYTGIRCTAETKNTPERTRNENNRFAMLNIQMFQGWNLTLKNFLLPMYCRECGERLLTEENCFFCPDCWESSPRIERPFCTGCGKPHQRMVGLGALSNYPCADCREAPNRFIRRTFGAAYYDGTISAAIRIFKFQKKRSLKNPLAALMLDFAFQEMNEEHYDFLVPVPLYRTRLRERGFNQSLELTELLLEAFPEAILDESLVRIRPTPAQSSLVSSERARNVRGAFAVKGDLCKGKRILLIDDVITTGETTTECARALKRAGALSVDAFAAALACPVPRFDL
ncbi:MAG: ComF family protein [Candidatus Hydrogenedentes bacterium]|nr:ComF family protein [Candidatus Hydrogenedentota bacterium]